MASYDIVGNIAIIKGEGKSKAWKLKEAKKLLKIPSVKTVLEKEGYEVLTSTSADDCLKKVKENPKLDLVLMDIMMPGMDGFESASLLRKNKKTSKTPIIFVTAISKETQYVHKGHEVGAVDYFSRAERSWTLAVCITIWVEGDEADAAFFC